MTTDRRAKRPPRFGPEPFAEIGGARWSLWDLWFCVVARLDHDSNLDGVADTFVDALRSHQLWDRNANEAKLSHFRDLKHRLAEHDLDPTHVADDAVLADKTVVTRARNKVGGKVSLDGRALTAAMIDTPRKRLQRRARYGHWPSFPTDPQRFFERFERTVDRAGFVTKNQTFAITRTLRRRLDGLDGPRRTLADRLALYRAFHTAGLEIADSADDSYGVLGEARTKAWLTYLDIDWRSAGIDPDDYWQDLCELIIWEPYAIDHHNQTAWFATARPDDLDLIEQILYALEAEHRAVVLDWEADAALEAIADLYVATQTRQRYADVARRLPANSWQHLDKMARSHLATNDTDAAVAVYGAAIATNPTSDTLRTRCRDITGIDPDNHHEPGANHRR